jgi:hypothetical protein
MPWTTIGLAFAAGQNPYAALFLMAVLARSSDVEFALQSPFDLLTHPAAIAALFVLSGAQVFADKHPRWGQLEGQISAVARPVCAGLVVLGLLSLASVDVWLWLGLAVLAATGSHFLRMRLRRLLATSMGGMGYFLLSLTLDSAALITGLLAVLVPIAGAALGALMFAGAAFLPLRAMLNPNRNEQTSSSG